MSRTIPPLITSFLLCESAVWNDGVADLTGVTTHFYKMMPGQFDIDAFIAITNVHKTQNVIVTFSDAKTEHDGLTSAPQTISVDDPTATVQMIVHFPKAQFPKYGEYIARIKTEAGDILSQIKMAVLPPNLPSSS